MRCAVFCRVECVVSRGGCVVGRWCAVSRGDVRGEQQRDKVRARAPLQLVSPGVAATHDAVKLDQPTIPTTQ